MEHVSINIIYYDSNTKYIDDNDLLHVCLSYINCDIDNTILLLTKLETYNIFISKLLKINNKLKFFKMYNTNNVIDFINNYTDTTSIYIFCNNNSIIDTKLLNYIDYSYHITIQDLSSHLSSINKRNHCYKKYHKKILFNNIIHNYSIKIKKYIINFQELQYINLIDNILKNGDKCDDRTKFGTLSVNGKSISFNITNNFPLITSKFTSFKCIAYELLWFISGSTDNSYLTNNKIHIWDKNTSKENIKKLNLPYNENDAGPIYGFNFRHYGANYIDCGTDYTNKGIDQLNNVIENLKINPTSRRHIINLWDPLTINKAVLPPCHTMYQFLSNGIYLDCIMFQRSADVGLGLPFNIGSVALLTYIIGFLTKLTPRNITIHLGNSHIYNNHISTIKTLINKDPLQFPKLKIINRNQKSINDFIYKDFNISNYRYYNKLKMDMNV